MRAGLLLSLFTLFLAGCLTTATDLSTPTDLVPVAGATLVAAGNATDAVQGFYWSGDATKGLTQKVQLELPEGYWQTHQGGLEISVVWPHNISTTYTVTVSGPNGASARGTNGWYASVIVLPKATAGTYTVSIRPGATNGAGKTNFDAIVQLDALPLTKAAGIARLPNLVTIPPVDLQIESPTFGAGGSNGPTRGCGYDETAEYRALRCLRVSNGVGNIGPGPLEVRLSLGEAAKSPAGLGVWMQRLYHDDGTIKEVPVGNAVFHATHAHWHYSGLAKFDLYKYDLEDKKRGDHVGKSNKNGFCFFDIGLVELGLPNTPMKGYSGSACLTADPQQQAWFMGLSPNWFDFYHWNLPDQYVEITGLPDGVYELVSTASGTGLLHETDKTDNTASAVIRLTGNNVQTLASWADYQD